MASTKTNKPSSSDSKPAKKSKRKTSSSSSAAEIQQEENGESPDAGEKQQQQQLFKRDAFICSTGHNAHLDEDYETDETLLVGRKVLRNKWPSGISIDSRSLRSVSSEATLSVASSLDYVPTPLNTLERRRNKHLQTVPEEGGGGGSGSGSSSRPRIDLDTTSLISGTSSAFQTPRQSRRHFNLFRRFRSTDEKSGSRDSLASSASGHRAKEERNLGKNSLLRAHSVDAYEPYTFFEAPAAAEEETRKLLKKHGSKTSLQSAGGSRNAEGRLLVARGSVVHPVGVFGEAVDVPDPAASYATVLDPNSGRPRLIRRDSVIHPPTSAADPPLPAGNELLRRRNSGVRPLALTEGTDPDSGDGDLASSRLYKRDSITHSYGVGADREALIDRQRMMMMANGSDVVSPSSSMGRLSAAVPLSEAELDRLPGPKFINGRFENPFGTWRKPGIMAAFKWKLTSRDNSAIPAEDVLNKKLPMKIPKFGIGESDDGIRVTWLGHSTVLVQMDGLNILTDPMFSDRASMVQFMGPKRYRPPPCEVKDLPRIDAVLISHNHYDHLDSQSVYDLNERFGNTIRWFVPLNLREWMEQVGCADVIEMNWWETERIPLMKDMEVVFTPAQHWCKRTATDDNKVLWGSWCVLGPKHRFFFAGDTGYCNIFKIIGKKYGPFHLAAIPIGAYEPRWFMKPQHVDPEEAVCIHEDVRAMQSIGIHWGTFALANEHYLEPPKKLQEALTRKALLPHEFFTLKHGETRIISNEGV